MTMRKTPLRHDDPPPAPTEPPSYFNADHRIVGLEDVIKDLRVRLATAEATAQATVSRLQDTIDEIAAALHAPQSHASGDALVFFLDWVLGAADCTVEVERKARIEAQATVSRLEGIAERFEEARTANHSLRGENEQLRVALATAQHALQALASPTHFGPISPGATAGKAHIPELRARMDYAADANREALSALAAAVPATPTPE